MNAAIYARKSTDQNAVADDQRSVARQIDGGRAFAALKGLSVDARHVYSDDGYSGADFNRPGYKRMMAAAERREFSVLIMSEDSRLGREQIETGYALKCLDQAGVKIIAYSDGRERSFITAMDKMQRSISAYADEQERESARKRTHDAMMKKAMQKHVTGGRVFGYDNVPIYASGARHGTGEPVYKVREINEGEAVVVRRIFEMIGEGYGLKAVAKRLNDDGVLRPRPQRDRPSGWVASSILPMLERELYRGEIVYNTTRKRDDWGRKNQQPRPESEWLRVPAPELRIVTDEQWQRAQEQRAVKRKSFNRSANGKLQGRLPGAESKYLLAGLARCAACNGTMHVRSRSHGKRREYHYGCAAYHERGTTVCANGAIVLMSNTDAAIINELESAVMNEAVIAKTVSLVRERLKSSAPTVTASREALTAEAESIEDRIKNLVNFIASGVESKAIGSELRELESKLLAIEAQVAACDARLDVRLDDDLDSKIAAKVSDWRAVLAGNVAPTRVLLRKLLVGPIIMTALPGNTGYRFDGKIKLDELLAIGGAVSVASPTGFEPVF